MEDIKIFKLVKALDKKLEPFVGEDFVLVNNKGNIYKMGGMGKAFGRVVITDEDTFKKEFLEIDLDERIDSMIEQLIGGIIGEELFNSIKSDDKEEKVKEPIKEEPKEEMTQLDRIEMKLDKIMKFYRID